MDQHPDFSVASKKYTVYAFLKDRGVVHRVGGSSYKNTVLRRGA